MGCAGGGCGIRWSTCVASGHCIACWWASAGVAASGEVRGVEARVCLQGRRRARVRRDVAQCDGKGATRCPCSRLCGRHVWWPACASCCDWHACRTRQARSRRRTRSLAASSAGGACGRVVLAEPQAKPRRGHDAASDAREVVVFRACIVWRHVIIISAHCDLVVLSYAIYRSFFCSAAPAREASPRAECARPHGLVAGGSAM
jgi:hypothetical protein